MKSNISRVLIETIVRKTLTEIKDSPERSSRNLVDMALHFAKGRFQQHFLQMAQDTLRDENSPFYALIQDIVHSVDTERILTFGMNIGYNSCTRGADVIRSLEESNHFNIPWALALELDPAALPAQAEKYQTLLSQGKELGIYAWLLFSDPMPQAALFLAAQNPDCAFVLFCDPESITEALLDEAEPLYNLMFAVRRTDPEYTGRALDALRSRAFLYSVCYSYNSGNQDFITGGDCLSEAQIWHPAFTIFSPEPGCPLPVRHTITDYARSARLHPQFRTAPLELFSDMELIDSVISDDACSAGFDREGRLYTIHASGSSADCLLFRDTLSDILRRTFPKEVPVL